MPKHQPYILFQGHNFVRDEIAAISAPEYSERHDRVFTGVAVFLKGGAIVQVQKEHPITGFSKTSDEIVREFKTSVVAFITAVMPGGETTVIP